MEEDKPIRGAMHAYAKKSLDAAFKGNDAKNASGGKVPLPETPRQPAKKSKLGERAASDIQMVSNSNLMEVLERVEKMQLEFMNRMKSLEANVQVNTASLNGVTEALEFMSNQIEEVSSKVSSLQNRVDSLEKENCVLRDKCEELDAYKRRWNLRVSGIQEQRGEDVRKIRIDLFSKVSPEIAGQLVYTLDIAHRLGPRAEGARASSCSFCHAMFEIKSGGMPEPLPFSKKGKSEFLKTKRKAPKTPGTNLWNEQGRRGSRLQRPFCIC